MENPPDLAYNYMKGSPRRKTNKTKSANQIQTESQASNKIN